MPRDPFKPLSPRKSIVSDHPKSISDRKYSHAKSGLALARRRDMSAYRTSKSRKLKALHGSAKWKTLSESDRVAAEAEIVAALDQQLVAKSKVHTLQWRKLVETGEVSENDADDEKAGDDDVDAMVLDPLSEGKVLADSDDAEGAWVTDSEDQPIDEVFGHQSNVYETPFHGVREIRDVAAEGWKEKMKVFEAEAEVMDKMWLDIVNE
jgi:hypothetical protein